VTPSLNATSKIYLTLVLPMFSFVSEIIKRRRWNAGVKLAISWLRWQVGNFKASVARIEQTIYNRSN
jgi:hypothetical protein